MEDRGSATVCSNGKSKKPLCGSQEATRHTLPILCFTCRECFMAREYGIVLTNKSTMYNFLAVKKKKKLDGGDAFFYY